MSSQFKAGPWLAVAFVAVCGVLAWKYYPREEAAPSTPVATVAPVAEAPRQELEHGRPRPLRGEARQAIMITPRG